MRESKNVITVMDLIIDKLSAGSLVNGCKLYATETNNIGIKRKRTRLHKTPRKDKAVKRKQAKRKGVNKKGKLKVASKDKAGDKYARRKIFTKSKISKIK